MEIHKLIGMSNANSDREDPSPVIHHTGRFLRFERRGNWEYVHRHSASGAVGIIALTDAGELILTEQFRIPLQARAIELPAGIIGDEAAHFDEDFLEGARRELLEETGYLAERLELLLSGPSSAGLATEVVALVKATGLRRTGPGGGVGDEQITTHHVPLQDVPRWLAERRRAGILADFKVYAALHLCGVAISAADERQPPAAHRGGTDAGDRPAY